MLDESSSSNSSSSYNHDDNDDDAADDAPSFYAYMKIPSALLSFLCSALVIWHVYGMSNTRRSGPSTSNRRSRNAGSSTTTRFLGNTYHRLLVGLCVLDMVSSITMTVEPWLARISAKPHWTCSTSGFLKVTGIMSGSSYNAALATYFFVVICREWKPEKMVIHRLELPWHAFIFSLIAFLASGLWLQVYNPSGEAGCWAVAYPQGCTTSDSSPLEATVTENQERNRTYPTLRSLVDTIDSRTDQQTIASDEGILDTVPCTRGGRFGWIFDLVVSIGFVIVVFVLLFCNIAIYCKVRRQEARNRRYEFEDQQRTSSAGNRRESTNISIQLTDPASGSFVFERQASQNSISTQGRNNDQTFQVAVQSFLYCGGYLAVYLTLFLHNIATGGVQKYNAAWYPIVRSFQEIMFPLQGFFNALVYFRPRYVLWRDLQKSRAASNQSRLKALQLALSRRLLPLSRSLTNRMSSQGGGSSNEGQSDSIPAITNTPRQSRTINNMVQTIDENVLPKRNHDETGDTIENKVAVQSESRVRFAHAAPSSSSLSSVNESHGEA